MNNQVPVSRGKKPPFYKNVFVRHPVFPLSPLGRAEREDLASLEPVVVMGRGHSGTRVVAWMIDHLGVDLGVDPTLTPSADPVDGSLRHHLRIVAERSMKFSATERPDAITLNRFQKAIRGHLQRREDRLNSQQWGWKFPESYLSGPAIIETFPSARFVHLIRDGRDLAFKRHLTDLKEHRLARRILLEAGLIDAPHYLQAGASWALQVERFLDFAAALPENALLTVRYEDLVGNPMAQLRSLADFLETPVTDAASDFALLQVSSADRQSHAAQDPDLVREVEGLIGGTLLRTGYPLAN